MRLVRGVALLVSLAGIPVVGAAQHAEGKHEVGVDVTIAFNYLGSQSGVSCSADCGTFSINTPVDVRIGIVSGTAWSFEPRFGIAYSSNVFNGGSALQLTPGVNVLYALKGNAHRGAYVTGGLGVLYLDIGGGGGSATQLSLNGGVGTRVPWESAAVRIEGYLRYRFEAIGGIDLYSSYEIGTRIGFSLWH